MRVKLGYPDKVVEIDGSTVRVFNGKLYSAPLEEVIAYYLSGNGVLPPKIRDVATDIVRFLLRTGDLETVIHSKVQYGESLSD